jgi:hypothetical protein
MLLFLHICGFYAKVVTIVDRGRTDMVNNNLSIDIKIKLSYSGQENDYFDIIEDLVPEDNGFNVLLRAIKSEIDIKSEDNKIFATIRRKVGDLDYQVFLTISLYGGDIISIFMKEINSENGFFTVLGIRMTSI